MRNVTKLAVLQSWPGQQPDLSGGGSSACSAGALGVPVASEPDSGDLPWTSHMFP